MMTDNMRLIDANALPRNVWLDGNVLVIAVAEIDNSPTIEAEPVKHGRWERVTPYGTYKCSVCGGLDTNCDDYYGSHYVTD